MSFSQRDADAGAAGAILPGSYSLVREFPAAQQLVPERNNANQERCNVTCLALYLLTTPANASLPLCANEFIYGHLLINCAIRSFS